MKVASLHSPNVKQLSVELDEIIKHQFTPQLALVFTSIHHDISLIASIFTNLNIDLIGCTTAGEIVDDQLHHHSIAVFLMDIDKSFYNIILEKYEYSDIQNAAKNLGSQAMNDFKNPGLLLLTSGMTINAEQVISGLRETTKKTTPIFGGLAGDDLNMKQTIVFTNDQIEDQALACMVLDTDKIEIHGLSASGWQAVGVENTVTKAKDNVLLEINGEPAFTIFSKYFGLSDQSMSNHDQLLSLQTNYPFQFIRDEGHTILRSPFVLDKEEGSITFLATIKEGSKFKFSYSPGFEVIEQTINEFGNLKNLAADADGTILFSCKGRHGAFGPLLEKEIAGIFNYWKKPMIGFLSYGEIGDIGNGVCEFHNETCSLVILKEK